ncbi:MAG TPA: hypothetical protein VG293_10870 [Solirubrobacteraceae bacterium]|jgi:hypothetical protein|nr:hypothetical protein [Solirubrobacteraceae bacterium]
MFHVEMRMGIQLVREFNLSERRLWLQFLQPLMADQDFTLEGHEFSPRQTRLKVYEGPELRPDQLGMGRGWQNVERSAGDVTERVLARAREHSARADPERAQPAAADLLRERLIGRLSAGPARAAEVLAMAAEMMPDSSDAERLQAAQEACWALLERGVAQLTPSGR